MTTIAFFVTLILVILLARAYWISMVLEEEYETFCIAVDNYHTRHNAVARMAIMGGHRFTDWPLMPEFESYAKKAISAFFDLRIWRRNQVVSRSYLEEFEQDLNRLKESYYHSKE